MTFFSFSFKSNLQIFLKTTLNLEPGLVSKPVRRNQILSFKIWYYF